MANIRRSLQMALPARHRFDHSYRVGGGRARCALAWGLVVALFGRLSLSVSFVSPALGNDSRRGSPRFLDVEGYRGHSASSSARNGLGTPVSGGQAMIGWGGGRRCPPCICRLRSSSGGLILTRRQLDKGVGSMSTGHSNHRGSVGEDLAFGFGIFTSPALASALVTFSRCLVVPSLGNSTPPVAFAVVLQARVQKGKKTREGPPGKKLSVTPGCLPLLSGGTNSAL